MSLSTTRKIVPTISVPPTPGRQDRRFVTNSVMQILSYLIHRQRTEEDIPEVLVGGLLVQTNNSGRWITDSNFAVLCDEIDRDPELIKDSGDAISLAPYLTDFAIEGFAEAIDGFLQKLEESGDRVKFSYAATWQAFGLKNYGFDPKIFAETPAAIGSNYLVRNKLDSECAFVRVVFEGGHQVSIAWNRQGESVFTFTSVDLAVHDTYMIAAPRVLLSEGRLKESIESPGKTVDSIIQLSALHTGVSSTLENVR